MWKRYITLLREFTDSAVFRLALLRSVSRFWVRNSQFLIIVFDKLLQYRIVDPIDVVNWVFLGEQPVLDGEVLPRDWTNVSTWDILRMTLEKVQTRVAGAATRLGAFRRREENRIDAERAAGAEANEAAAEAANTAVAELEAAERQLESVKREQEVLVVEIVRKYHQTFANLDVGNISDEWLIWFAKGWWAEFCRAVGPNVCIYAI